MSNQPSLSPYEAIAFLPCVTHTRSQADKLAYKLRITQVPQCFCTRITLSSGQEVYLIANPLETPHV